VGYADERDAVAAKMRDKPLWYREIMRQIFREKWDREARGPAEAGKRDPDLPKPIT
jgi:hypothetical protein